MRGFRKFYDFGCFGVYVGFLLSVFVAFEHGWVWVCGVYIGVVL